MSQTILYVLGVVNVAILGWLIFLTRQYLGIKHKAAVIFEDPDAAKIVSLLNRYFKNIEEVNDNHLKLQRVLKKTKETADLGLSQVAFQRYNPFGDVGSDQSFSLCLLNNANDGFVISSIHSREGTRVYAKPVKAGVSSYNLSSEEQKVIERAHRSQKKNNDKNLPQ